MKFTITTGNLAAGFQLNGVFDSVTDAVTHAGNDPDLPDTNWEVLPIQDITEEEKSQVLAIANLDIQSENKKLATELHMRFTFLGTDEDAGSGADVVAALVDWYYELVGGV